MLVDRARSDGPQLTKRVLESALEGEITDHVGYDKHDAAGRTSGNSRDGTRAKAVPTDVGPVKVKVPRDTAGTFEPQLVKKRQRRLTGVDEMVLSLSAKGLTHGGISAHLAEAYEAQVSKQAITTITTADEAGLAALRMWKVLDAEADREAVLASFVTVLSPGDEQLLRYLLAQAADYGEE